MEKRVIVGRSIKTERETSEDLSIIDKIRNVCREYTDDDHIKTAYVKNPERNKMKNGMMYCWDASFDLTCPKFKVREKVRLSSNTILSPQEFRVIHSEKESECIEFFMQSDNRIVGYWFINEKTLVLYWCANDVIAREILKFLGSNGYLTGKGTVSNVETEEIFEIHDGVKVSVKAPIKKVIATVGCDPEFEVLVQGKPCHPPECYGSSDCNVEIGRDGSGCQLELRPKSGNIDDVINNIKKLMGKLEHPISVIGDSFPLGGHIHVGIGYVAQPTEELLWLLDYFLGIEVLELSGYAREGYRKLGAYERKRWGFEYRTPPAAIFAGPDFARLAMMICKNVTEAYVNGRTIRVTPKKPIAEDFMNYCGFTEEDCVKWISCIDSYKKLMKSSAKYSINFAHCWDSSIKSVVSEGLKLKEPKKKPQRDTQEREALLARAGSMNITFSDDWRSEVIAMLLDELNRQGCARFRNGVTFYGLHRDRGILTSGFKVSMCETRERSSSISNYGFPRIFRDNAFEDMSGFVVEAVKDILKLQRESER